MADKIIRLKIDVTKINKTKLYKGEKGTYLSCTILLNDQADQYGNNGMIIEDTTKEEREAGNRGNILGNAKIAGQAQQTNSNPASTNAPDEDIPF